MFVEKSLQILTVLFAWTKELGYWPSILQPKEFLLPQKNTKSLFQKEPLKKRGSTSKLVAKLCAMFKPFFFVDSIWIKILLANPGENPQMWIFINLRKPSSLINFFCNKKYSFIPKKTAKKQFSKKLDNSVPTKKIPSRSSRAISSKCRKNFKFSSKIKEHFNFGGMGKTPNAFQLNSQQLDRKWTRARIRYTGSFPFSAHLLTRGHEISRIFTYVPT